MATRWLRCVLTAIAAVAVVATARPVETGIRSGLCCVLFNNDTRVPLKECYCQIGFTCTNSKVPKIFCDEGTRTCAQNCKMNCLFFLFSFSALFSVVSLCFTHCNHCCCLHHHCHHHDHHHQLAWHH